MDDSKSPKLARVVGRATSALIGRRCDEEGWLFLGRRKPPGTDKSRSMIKWKLGSGNSSGPEYPQGRRPGPTSRTLDSVGVCVAEVGGIEEGGYSKDKAVGRGVWLGN